jgi:dTDP-4-dehydrorhamnose 3,5-epimerase
MSTPARKDTQSTDANWSLPESPIHGAIFFESKNVVTERAVIRECYRKDWSLNDSEIKHIIAVTSWPKQILGWHKHMIQTDHLFPLKGSFKAVLFDDRDSSPSKGQIHVLQLSDLRPGVLVIPPGIWHAFENLTEEPATLLNYFDREYQYHDPDEYKLPLDSPQIPYSFRR